jgi:phage tail sheath gpL-like
MAIPGYPSSWRAPFTAVHLLFAQGPSNAAAGQRSTIFTMPKTSAGSAVVNQVYEVRSESQAIELAGAGSPLHRAVRMRFRSSKLGRVYIQAYAASSGSGVATATGTITVSFGSGSNPTAQGLLSFRVAGERMAVSFRTSDTATTIAEAIVAQVNAKPWLPCTATNSSGVVTLTAKIAGASQGDCTVGVIRFAASVEPGKNVVVATSGAALGLGTGTAGADGSTTELANLTAAIAARAAARYYYEGYSVWTSTETAEIENHVNTVSLPNPGLRCSAWFAFTGALSSLQTIAIARNHERVHPISQPLSEHDPAELVGNVLAVHHAEEQLRGGFVHDNYRGGLANWLILPVATEADWLDSDDINDAITDGITPIASDQTGSRMVMSVNSRSKDATGAVDDFRATDRHRVSFMDEFADTWLVRHQQTWGGKKLKDDQRLPNGEINHNQELPAGFVTPSLYQKWFSNIITEFESDGVLQNGDEWKQSLSFEIEANNNSRISGSASGRTVDILHQTELRLAETTPG